VNAQATWLRICDLAQSLPNGEPLGVTMGELVSFNRALVSEYKYRIDPESGAVECKPGRRPAWSLIAPRWNAETFLPVRAFGHRLVVIPDDWADELSPASGTKTTASHQVDDGG
jgi:hypothetical protein